MTEGRSASAAVAKAPGKAGAEEEATLLLLLLLSPPPPTPLLPPPPRLEGTAFIIIALAFTAVAVAVAVAFAFAAELVGAFLTTVSLGVSAARPPGGSLGQPVAQAAKARRSFGSSDASASRKKPAGALAAV